MRVFLLCHVLLCTLLAQSANATITVVPEPPTQNATPSVFDWGYTASLQPGQAMSPGDFFTIYDFPMADLLSFPQFTTSNADQKAAFNVSVQSIGINPPKTSFPDKPAITNVTVTLLDGNGETPTPDSLSAAGGPLRLGTLIIQSPSDMAAESTFGSVVQSNTEHFTSSLGPIGVAAIPEPQIISLLLSGLFTCAAARLGYRRTVA